MWQGQLIVVSAPSGAGKTSLVRYVVDNLPDVKASISYTTRQPRPGEIDGVHYNFVSKKEFQNMIHDMAFLEHAIVHNHLYGTSKFHVQRQLSEGNDVILEIDYQGAQEVKKNFPEAVLVYILPPSLKALSDRLKNRGQDSEAVISGRLAAAKNELQHYDLYDYLVVNEDFDYAKIALASIIQAGHFRCKVQKEAHRNLLEQLLNEEIQAS